VRGEGLDEGVGGGVFVRSVQGGEEGLETGGVGEGGMRGGWWWGWRRLGEGEG